MKTTFTLNILGKNLLPVAVGLIAATTLTNNQVSANELPTATNISLQETVDNLQNEVTYRQARIADDQARLAQATPEKIAELRSELNIEGLTTDLADKKFALETAETDVKIYEYQLKKLKNVESAKEYYATLTPELEKSKKNLITASTEFKKSETALADAEHYLGKYTNAAAYLENSKEQYAHSLNELNKIKSELEIKDITKEDKVTELNLNQSVTANKTNLPPELITILASEGLTSQNLSKTLAKPEVLVETTKVILKSEQVKNTVKENILPKTAALVESNATTYAGLTAAGLVALSAFTYRKKRNKTN